MFAKVFALFALMAVAFAAPSPKAAPEPSPQVLTYSAGLDYLYPGAAGYPSVVSPYASPLAYSAYPAGAVYLR